MTIKTFPAITPNSSDFGLQSNAQAARSELNGTIQTTALPGDIWTSVDTFTNLFDPKARILRAFLTSLRGQAGRFYKSPPGYRMAGTAVGAAMVLGAGQSGLSLLTDGWLADQPSMLLAGDYFQIGNELKMMTADAASDSFGHAILHFTPPLRAIPADNAPIITTRPCCVMMLKDGNQSRWQSQPTPIYFMTIACEEALDIA